MSARRVFPDFESPEIFPAIDVRGGRCVRLVRGRRDAEIRYDEDPVEVAGRFEAAGARCLHVIDLGGAFREPPSTDVVLAIADRVGIPVQAGGGIRDGETVSRLLDGGVARVILGTRALRDPAFLQRTVERHGERHVVVGIDCDGERVKVAGWEEESPLALDAALRGVREAGVRRLLVTAIDRDGTLAGGREDLVRRVLAGAPDGAFRVVAAGGIGCLEHVESLLAIDLPGLEGVVIGRALYEGTVDLGEALKLAGRSA